MSPALISRYTVMVDTLSSSATSAAVRNRALPCDDDCTRHHPSSLLAMYAAEATEERGRVSGGAPQSAHQRWPSSSDLSLAAVTASRRAPRTARDSSTRRAAAVVPPGEVTA